MPEPFEPQSDSPRGLVRRMLPGSRKSSCLREVEDLLARADGLREVTPDDVASVAEAHGVDLSRELRTPGRSLYQRFLRCCLEDGAISEEERRDLEHLRRLLQVDDQEAARAHEQVAQSVYGAAIREVLADFRLEPDEEAFLERLRSDLNLSDEAAAELFDHKRGEARQRFLSTRAVHESSLVESKQAMFEGDGESPEGLEDAIRDAAEQVCQMVPEVTEAQVSEIRVRLEAGHITGWDVKLRAALEPRDS